MDVPTRQAFIMALVAPGERTAAASVTSLARGAGASDSPIFGGLLPQGPLLALWLPLIVAGALKAVQDLSLWTIFRRVRVGEVQYHIKGAGCGGRGRRVDAPAQACLDARMPSRSGCAGSPPHGCPLGARI